MAFQPVAKLDDLWSGEMKACDAGGTKVLLIRMGETVWAYENRCAHLGAPLSDGTLTGAVLTCAAHHWQYDACTGRGINPAAAQLRSFPVEIRDGSILVDTGSVP